MHQQHDTPSGPAQPGGPHETSKAMPTEQAQSSRLRLTLTTSKFEKSRYESLETTAESVISGLMRRGHQIGEKDGSGIIAAVFTPNTKIADENVQFVTAVILDVDGKFRRNGVEVLEHVDPREFVANLPFLGVVHSSFSNSSTHPKFRVILPLAEEVTPSEFLRLWSWLYEKTGRKADPTTKNPSRMFYLPRCPAKGLADAFTWRIEGPLLSVRDVPADFVPTTAASGGPAASARPLQHGSHSAGTSKAYPVDRPSSAATLMELLDGAYVRWMVNEPGAVSREAWRTLATNLHAACSGHADLLELARGAWHAVSAQDHARYLRGSAEKMWSDAASSAPIGFEHASNNGAPDEACSPDHKNIVLEARERSRVSRRSQAYVEAALAYLTQNPGTLTTEAQTRSVTTRALLIDEGFLEDTTGYVSAALRARGQDDEEVEAPPA